MLLRRGFLTGLASLICAPAIVRASSLMPVRSYDWTEVSIGYSVEEPGFFAPDAYPDVCNRIPVMLDGVIRYLRPEDTKIWNGQPLYPSFTIEEWVESRRDAFNMIGVNKVHEILSL